MFFDDVKVPVENLVYEEGKGWTVAKYLLGHERMNTGRIGASKRELAKLKEFAAAQTARTARPLIEDARFRDKLSRVEVELMALEITNLRFLDQMRRSGQPPGADVSMLKIKGTEIQQALTELTMQAVGPLAQPFRPIDAPVAARDDFDPFVAGARAALRQLAQDDDLRRIERDPAQHHLQDDVGAVGGHELRLQRRAAAAGRLGAALPRRRTTTSRRARRSSHRRPATARMSGRTFAEMGLLGLPLPQDHGGFGGGAVDLMAVMEAFGDGLVVEPYLATVGLGAQFIARAGSDGAEEGDPAGRRRRPA